MLTRKVFFSFPAGSVVHAQSREKYSNDALVDYDDDEGFGDGDEL